MRRGRRRDGAESRVRSATAGARSSSVAPAEHGRVELRARPPLRLGATGTRAPASASPGSAPATASVDHAGQRVQLGADRRYTGPDCPPDMLDLGGIPQGDYAPGAVAACRAAATRSGSRPRRRHALRARRGAHVSARSAAGPLRLHAALRPLPGRAPAPLLRATGLPALLPEWGYGFWKSRDVYEHQDDVRGRFDGCRGTRSRSTRSSSTPRGRRSTTPGSPTPTSSRISPGMVGALPRDGVRTVVWVTPWVNVDSRDGQLPPDPVRAAARRAGAPTTPGRGGRPLRRDADGEPFVPLVDGQRLAGRLHLAGGR